MCAHRLTARKCSLRAPTSPFVRRFPPLGRRPAPKEVHPPDLSGTGWYSGPATFRELSVGEGETGQFYFTGALSSCLSVRARGLVSKRESIAHLCQIWNIPLFPRGWISRYRYANFSILTWYSICANIKGMSYANGSSY